MPPYVDKIHVPVQIALSADEPVGGHLSLAPRAQFHEGPETLLELLNGSLRVLPFLLGDNEPTRLIARDAITWVTAGPDTPAGMISPRTYQVTHEERVQIRFKDGRQVDGILRMELPEHLNRVSDFMNAPEDFFALTSGVRTLLIQKSAVREVRLFHASPSPIGEAE
jgi:hypothetical protein